jgi:hypothetical protein
LSDDPRHADARGAPHKFGVHAEVLVNHDVAHAGHVRPRDIRVREAKLWRNPFGGLADHRKVVEHRANHEIVRCK